MLWTENREDYGWIRRAIKGHPWAFIAPSFLLFFFLGMTFLSNAVKEREAREARVDSEVRENHQVKDYAPYPLTIPGPPVWGPRGGPSCEGTGSGPSKDRTNARVFCTNGIPQEVAHQISRVVAQETFLTIHIDRELALEMRRNSLDAQRAMRAWIGIWKQVTNSPLVTVEVEWEGVPIAMGDVSFFGGGDQVTIY